MASIIPFRLQTLYQQLLGMYLHEQQLMNGRSLTVYIKMEVDQCLVRMVTQQRSLIPFPPQKVKKLFLIFQHRRRAQLVLDFTLHFSSLQLQRILVNTSQYFFKCQKIKRQSTHLNQPISWKLVFQMVRQTEAVHTVYFIILGNFCGIVNVF